MKSNITYRNILIEFNVFSYIEGAVPHLHFLQAITGYAKGVKAIVVSYDHCFDSLTVAKATRQPTTSEIDRL